MTYNFRSIIFYVGEIMSHKKKTETTKDNNPFNNKMELDEHKDLTEETVEEKPVEEQEEQIVSQDNELQKKLDVLNSQYVRLAADFDNYRKRQEQERENLLKYGAEETLKKLLTVLDNFDRGEKAVENLDDCQKVKESFSLVCNQMRETLSKIGLEEIDAEGQEFNPTMHEAVMQTPTEDYPENTVITVLQKGYKIGDKVLRAALVNVATKG